MVYSIICGEVPEWPKGTDCKSVGNAFGGSNPPLPIFIIGFWSVGCFGVGVIDNMSNANLEKVFVWYLILSKSLHWCIPIQRKKTEI